MRDAKNIFLISILCALSALPFTALAVIELPGNSTDTPPAGSTRTMCTSNATCQTSANAIQGVCSDVHFAGDNQTLKICSRCNTTGSATCTSGTQLCDVSGSCVAAVTGCTTHAECAAGNTIPPGSPPGSEWKCLAPPSGTGPKSCVFETGIATNGCTPGATPDTCGTGKQCRAYDSANASQGGYCGDLQCVAGATSDTCPSGYVCTANNFGGGCRQDFSTPVGDTTAQGTVRLVNALQATTFEGLVTDILDGVVQLGAIFLVLALVWIGFLFATAGGKEESIKKARESLFWCVIGGLMLLGAEAISLAIKGFVGEL